MDRGERLLHHPDDEHDACGVGFVADLRGRASHALVADALTILHRLAHRGAVGADAETGDGAGILMEIPHALYAAELAEAGVTLPGKGEYGLATVFLARGPEQEVALERVKEAVSSRGLEILHTRFVPVVESAAGAWARETAPTVVQVFVARPAEEPFARALYLARRAIEAHTGSYVCSFSARTVVYKGLLQPAQLVAYYPDLTEPLLVASYAVVHQRFSTNTTSTWSRAQPFGHVAHNGEINTLRGNLSRMGAREPLFAAPWMGDEERALLTPVLDPKDSDSANLDRALELLLHTGRSLPHAAAMLVPEAWEGSRTLSSAQRGFWAWHAAVMEPWDGPACVVYTDGDQIGAALDRNGLRPARWTLTRDGRVLLASEAGVLDLPGSAIIRRGRLGPGQQLLVDPARGRLLLDEQIKGALANKRDYRRWLTDNRVRLRALRPGAPQAPPRPEGELRRDQAVFGYTLEELSVSLLPMASGGKEPVAAMGDDTPLAVLSERPRSLSDYFVQRFAQVTNPPIDPIRERSVMSLRVSLGAEGNLFEEAPEHCRQVELNAPIITPDALTRLEETKHAGVSVARLDALFDVPADALELPDRPSLEQQKRAGRFLRRGVERLAAAAERAVLDGATIVVLSDRGHGVERAPIPIALAVAAVQSHLLRAGLRGRAGLIAETGEVRDSHQAAVLLGYGAGAVVPWLALDTVADLARSGRLDGDQATPRTLAAFHHGLLKILSKMGISTLESYRGAQLFQILGLSESLVKRWFTGTPAVLGGADLGVVACEALLRHREAWQPAPVLATGGRTRWRRDAEPHAWNPQTLGLLQHAVRSGNEGVFRKFAAAADAPSVARQGLRSLLRLKPDRAPIPLDEVEPVAQIVTRFRTGAMSFGSLSKEAHETLAVAMNRLGARSNSGEGGEDPGRNRVGPDGDSPRSAIKQVASGRFGVTPQYLGSADELQIKMAQGAKPGEGGQLPGHKVDAAIAATRHSTPGVTLVSPPPHHDIYSIEDLRQLIHDLKQANGRATVSVKLVAQGGVGTVAAGVVKAGADGILISGRSGGTGASPLGSIQHAGLPWELGLSEVRQALMQQGLRDRVTVETDGQLKTGRDVLVAALLGAERFGFGTAALVSSGCVMMRVCHKNTCPVGVATQDPALRALFAGAPEHVMNFMLFVAGAVREQLAELGYRSLDEVIGRSDLLEASVPQACWKARDLDLRPMLGNPPLAAGAAARCTATERQSVVAGEAVDALEVAARPALEHGAKVAVALSVRNTDRSVGTSLAAAVVGRYGAGGLPGGTIKVDLSGTAGQSLGAFLAPGIDLRVVGGANDAVGKGMNGGSIAVLPPDGLPGKPFQDAIIGNVALYGATGGRLFVRGTAGERFAVRNSGAMAVVEGVGDHGCEYMTGGAVVVLGPTGHNFGAGMSGGRAWVLDRDGFFRTRAHRSDVVLRPVDRDEQLLTLLIQHEQATGSTMARRVLGNWRAWREMFALVLPADGGGSLQVVASKGRESEDTREVS